MPHKAAMMAEEDGEAFCAARISSLEGSVWWCKMEASGVGAEGSELGGCGASSVAG